MEGEKICDRFSLPANNVLARLDLKNARCEGILEAAGVPISKLSV